MSTSSRELLIEHYFPEGEPLAPEWYENLVVGAIWRCLPARDSEGRNMLLAVRCSDMGPIDSFAIPADDSETVEIVSSDTDLPLYEAVGHIQFQVDTGMSAANDEDAEKLRELVDAIMSNNQRN